MLITEFYENQEVFITGGSGFIGKALIEKLLRSCPGVGNIFVLLRGKKGKNVDERLKDILNTSLFNTLGEEQPDALKKVHAIEGDCGELGLGIKPADLIKLQNVTIIYHSAASVRFDDPLRDAILLNTRGTHELVKIAKTLTKLQVFVHVSTTYCNPDKIVVEEMVYPPYADWRTTIKLAETYSTETLNVLNLKYSDHQPNTYTFTKSLSEQVINDYSESLPVVIFRPSIVVSSMIEPFPGWIDNFNGPMGMLTACGLGIMRTNYGDPDIVSDFMPVDLVVRAMLISCYKRGTRHNDSFASNKLDVVNCASGSICRTTMGQIIETGTKIVKENPFEHTLWVPGGGITRCRVWNFLRFITLHILMALLVDTALRFTNQKPFLLKVQRRIYAANLALSYFTTISWIFKNENLLALDGQVPKEEIDKFGFLQFSDVDYPAFIRQALRGTKEFLLNEPPDSSSAARIRMKVFQAVHFLVQFLGAAVLVRCVYRYVFT